MTGFIANIQEKTVTNNHFRQVLFTGDHIQLVVMSLKPNEEIGLETHIGTDQFLRIESGTGKVIIDGEEQMIKDGDAIIVPSGCEHNIINTSEVEKLKLYTIYTPPHHKDGTVHSTKEQALSDTEDHL